jgi:hypothetical protein
MTTSLITFWLFCDGCIKIYLFHAKNLKSLYAIFYVAIRVINFMWKGV